MDTGWVKTMLSLHYKMQLFHALCIIKLHTKRKQWTAKLSAYTVVSRKYAPPFATLALVQSAGGGAYTWDATFSLAITPPDREMLSGSVDADIVLALPSTMETLNLTVYEFQRGKGVGAAGPRSARRRDAPDASGRLESFSVEGRGSRALPRSIDSRVTVTLLSMREVAGVSIVAAGGPRSR